MIDVCIVMSDTSSIELMFMYTNRRKIKFLVSCMLYVCNAGAPGRTVLHTDGVLLGKYDIINK